MLFHFAENTINGGIVFNNSGHRLAFGHVNNMRWLEKVYAFLFVCLTKTPKRLFFREFL